MPKVEYQEGQDVLYNGHKAKVVKTEPCSHYIYVEYGGKCQRVDTRFGLFNIAEEVNADCDKRIAASDAYIEKKKEKRSILEKIELAAKETVKRCANAMDSILRSYKATNIKGIEDADKQKEYLALMQDKSSARHTQISTSNEIYSIDGSILSEIFTKGNWINTKFVANAIAQSSVQNT